MGLNHLAGSRLTPKAGEAAEGHDALAKALILVGISLRVQHD